MWLGSRFCGHWVCRCLFYFTVQWFLYSQDDLPISSLSNVYDKCFQFFHDLLAGIPRRTKLPVEALLVTLVCAKCIPTIDVSISRWGWVEWMSIYVHWRWCINGHYFNAYIYIYFFTIIRMDQNQEERDTKCYRDCPTASWKNLCWCTLCVDSCIPIWMYNND